MHLSGNYVLKLYDMKDLVVERKGEKYVFCSVVAQRLKHIDATLYRRWFQLCQFTLDIKTVYGVPAINVDKSKQELRGHTSSLKIEVHITKGEDAVVREN